MLLVVCLFQECKVCKGNEIHDDDEERKEKEVKNKRKKKKLLIMKMMRMMKRTVKFFKNKCKSLCLTLT